MRVVYAVIRGNEIKPMTLDEANRAGKLKPNDTILMMAIGAGMSWGSAIVRW